MKPVSKQQLHAFVDNQLDRETRAQVLATIAVDSAAREIVDAYRQIKDGMQLAFAQEKPRRQFHSDVRFGFSGLTLSAIAGAVLMYIALQVLPVSRVLNDGREADIGASAEHQLATASAASAEQVLFHLSSGDSEIAGELLDQVELLALHYQQRGQGLRIVVVTNNEGLRLYEQGRTQHATRINELYTRFDNLTFAACGATLQRFARSGVTVNLLPQAIVVDSGVAEIARRQLQGWKYIRI